MFLPSLDILCFDRMLSGEVNVAPDAGVAGHVGIGQLQLQQGTASHGGQEMREPEHPEIPFAV